MFMGYVYPSAVKAALQNLIAMCFGMQPTVVEVPWWVPWVGGGYHGLVVGTTGWL
jgi:hypothetical protein